MTGTVLTVPVGTLSKNQLFRLPGQATIYCVDSDAHLTLKGQIPVSCVVVANPQELKINDYFTYKPFIGMHETISFDTRAVPLQAEYSQCKILNGEEVEDR